MKEEEANIESDSIIALAKAKVGMGLKEYVETAVLLFGGNGFTRTGQGKIAERIYYEVSGARIPEGSEDVMLDLAIRQLVKNFQVQTKVLRRPRGSSKI
jgi:acyl-CoA dehydrogenase